MTKDLFQMALNVTEPCFITDLEFDEKAKRLDTDIDFKRGSTFSNIDKESKKEVVGLKAYDTRDKKWRHLNFFEHECYIHATVPRVKLPNSKVKLIKTPWEGLSNGFKLLFEALTIQLCQSMPVNRVAQITKTSDNKLWDMLEKYIDTSRVEENFENIDAIGLDETSRAKGHEYNTYNKDVSCDMSPAFIKGVRDNLLDAKITFDKFHILKIINEAVDKVRKEEVGTNKLLKGTRYIWLKNANNLTVKQKAKLDELSLSK